MMRRSPEGNRDIALDITQIGTEVRGHLASLMGQGKDSARIKNWLAALERDPNKIGALHTEIFDYLNSRTQGDEDMERKIAAWKERLIEVN